MERLNLPYSEGQNTRSGRSVLRSSAMRSLELLELLLTMLFEQLGWYPFRSYCRRRKEQVSLRDNVSL